jgi:DNA-binding CsgD family transcriptional regulator
VELNPHEIRVATLVAAGLPNRRAGDRLGVSSRAVERHLTRVYRKLGIAGRAELPTALARYLRAHRPARPLPARRVDRVDGGATGRAADRTTRWPVRQVPDRLPSRAPLPEGSAAAS